MNYVIITKLFTNYKFKILHGITTQNNCFVLFEYILKRKYKLIDYIVKNDLLLHIFKNIGITNGTQLILTHFLIGRGW